MISHIAKRILGLISISAIVFSVFFAQLPVLAQESFIFADSKTQVCKGATFVFGGDCSEGKSEQSIFGTISLIINIFSWTIGIISVFMVIFAGLSIVTSGGDSGKVKNARNTITYAVIGLLFVALSQILTIFVVSKL